MVKTVQHKSGILFEKTALVLLGWITFALSLWLRPHFHGLSILLSMVARVLP